MKYKEQKFAKFIGSTGFFAILACCVLIIGAATWFAVSRYNEANKNMDAQPRNTESYNPIESSYDNIKEDISSAAEEIAEDVTNSVSDEPYSSESEVIEEKIENEIFTMPCEGEISKDYSSTELKYSATYGDMRLHTGIDIACEEGTSVWAMGEGKVVSVEESMSLGGIVTVDHGNGILIKYCGIENITVAPEDNIAAGEVIGASGEVPCECADQSHIHIEASKNGASISPSELLK